MTLQQLEMRKTKQEKGFQLFYIFPILYVLSVYLLPVFILMMQAKNMLSYLIYLPIVCGVLNIIVSIKFCKPENRYMMFHATVLVKYAMIPFFILGGLLVMASLLLSFIPVPFMIFLGPTVAVMGIIIGWLVLAFEAPYAISYLRLSAKAKTCSKVMAVLHSIFQFFFTLDVIDVMVLTMKERKWRRLTISIIILLAVAVMILIIRFIMGLE